MTDQELQQQYGGLATSTAPTVTAPVASRPQASQVYSTANVQQTLTNPAPAPDYSDPYKLRDYFYNSPDVVSARNDVKALTDKLNAFDTSQQNQQNYLENQTVAMPVITGEQANQARLGASTRESLSRELLAKQSYLDTATNEANAKYQIAQEQRGQLQGLITATNGKAGISYADTYESALKKADKYVTKQAEEQAKEARKQAEKDMLRQAYFQEFGKLPKKGMSTKEISNKLGKSNAEKKAFQKQLDQLELQTKQTALDSAKQSLAQGNTQNQSNTALANASSALLASRGTDGKADPGVYIQQRDNYLRTVKGSTPQAFDTQFGTLLSGNEQSNLGVSTVATRANNSGTKPLTQSAIEDNATMSVLKGYAQDLASQPSLAGVGGLGYGSTASFLASNLGIGTAEGQHNRNVIGNIQGTIAKLRGGTSFTPNEQRLLETYTPTINDSGSVIKQKLIDLSNFINDKQNAMSQISGQNYGGTQPSIQDQINEMKSAGYSDEQINLLLSQ